LLLLKLTLFPCIVFFYKCDSRLNFRLDIGFIDHFNAQLVITINYSDIANFHTLKSFASHNIFTRHFLIMDSNSGYSSACVLKFSLTGGSLTTASESYVTTDGQSVSLS
jgi:hypothetical protein